MRQSRLSIGLMAMAVSLLFLVPASAQHFLTACLNERGSISNSAIGLEPRTPPCRGNQKKVTFALRAAVDDVESQAINNDADIVDLQGQINNNDNDIRNLQGQITANANNIATNAGDIATHTNEIDHRTPLAIHGVLRTNSGSIGNDSTLAVEQHYLRTHTFFPGSGEWIHVGEFHHSVDPVDIDSTEGSENGWWFCVIGERVMSGGVQKLFISKGIFGTDDLDLLKNVGFTPEGPEGSLFCEGGCFAFQLRNFIRPFNANGRGSSPFAQILVRTSAASESKDPSAYTQVLPDIDNPVTGWVLGRTDLASNGDTFPLYVALSHPDLVKLLRSKHSGVALPTDDDDVVVDLDRVHSNLLFKPDEHGVVGAGDPR